MSTFNHPIQGRNARRSLTFVLLVTFLVSRLLFPVKGEEKTIALQQEKSATHLPIDSIPNTKKPKEQQVSSAFEPQNLIIPMLLAFGVYQLYNMNDDPVAKRQRIESGRAQAERDRQWERYNDERRLRELSR